MISRLKVKSSTEDVVDMVKWYNFTTFDLIGELAFGESFSCRESGSYHPWVAVIFSGFRLATYSQVLKRFPCLPVLAKHFLPQKLLKANREHQKLSFEKAKKRAESGQIEREDFMSYILRHNDEKGMSLDEIGENANVFIVAGSETTATLLSGTTFYLLKNPDIYSKLVEEIRSTFEREEDINLSNVGNLLLVLPIYSLLARRRVVTDIMFSAIIHVPRLTCQPGYEYYVKVYLLDSYPIF